MMRRLLLAACLLLPLAASAQTTTPAGAPPDYSLSGPKIAARFFGATVNVTPNGVAISAANRLMALPVFIANTSTVKTLNYNITTGNAAAWNVRLCIYGDNGAAAPGALVIDGGTDAVGSGSITGTRSVSLNAGAGVVLTGPAWYWVAFNTSDATAQVSSFGAAAGGPLSGSRLFGWSTVANMVTGTVATGVYVAQAFGACSNPFGAATLGDGVVMPYVLLGF